MRKSKNTFLYALFLVIFVLSCRGKEAQIEMRLEKVEREIANLREALDENSKILQDLSKLLNENSKFLNKLSNTVEENSKKLEEIDEYFGEVSDVISNLLLVALSTTSSQNSLTSIADISFLWSSTSTKSKSEGIKAKAECSLSAKKFSVSIPFSVEVNEYTQTGDIEKINLKTLLSFSFDRPNRTPFTFSGGITSPLSCPQPPFTFFLSSSSLCPRFFFSPSDGQGELSVQEIKTVEVGQLKIHRVKGSFRFKFYHGERKVEIRGEFETPCPEV